MRADRSHLRRQFFICLRDFIIGIMSLRYINEVLYFNFSTFSCLNFLSSSCLIARLFQWFPRLRPLVKLKKVRCERGCEVFQATLGRNIPLTIGTIFPTLNKSLTVKHMLLLIASAINRIWQLFLLKSTRPVSISRCKFQSL